VRAQPKPTILALVSAPLVNLNGESVPLLDADRELADLETWLREPGRAVELHVEWAETERLQRILLRPRRFDVLHYTGHGNKETLVFEDGRGGLQALAADRLADLVCPGGQSAFRLAFLSACHSERLAEALATAGVPHVVAVDKDEPVTDQAAAAFARAFYAALLAGQTVAAAFDQGQTSVRNDAELYRIEQKLGILGLSEREARKFRLLPTPEDGGDHSAPLLPPGLPAGDVTRHDPPSTPHRLGARPETFTGRQRELHQLVGHVLDNRLTVLTGMGGMGKTELARETGRWLAARGRFPAGIAWVDLREVIAPALIRARLAEAAGLPPEAARSDGDLAAALSGAPRLLILDDLDQAVRYDLSGLRRLLEAIYGAGAPHLLLTTRERLGRRPPAQYHSLGRLALHEAYQLFLDLARRHQPDLGGDLAALAAVLDFLGGWPLALVLAAPLLADYSLAELLRHLQREKELLLTDPDLPPVERDKLDSVDVSLSLSYTHLEQAHPEAARIFPLLALFPGGVDEAAIQAVLGPGALPAVARLRAASLVEEAGGTRVRLPGPARTYAERRLPSDTWEHYGPPGVAHYLALMESVGEVPLSHESGLSLTVTLTELPNLHVFADWGLAQEGETAARAARLVGSLRNLYMLLNWPEEGTTRLRLAVEAARQAGDGWAEANTRKAIGDVHNFRKELDDALASYAQALDLFRAVGSRLGEANTLLALAPFSENAEEVFGIALSLYEEIGDRYSLARGLYYLAQFLVAQGQTDRAIAALEQCRDLCLAVNLADHAAVAQQAINELSGQ